MPAYYSQFYQDELVDRTVFRGMRGGVFVDIGANDGVTINNTLAFEREYGWSGLCIEANPDIVPKLFAAGRSATVIHAAIASETGTLPFRSIRGGGNMLSSLVTEGTTGWHDGLVEREIAKTGGTAVVTEVPAMRLDDVLREHGLTEVHYLSVDTEGNESMILGTLNSDETFVHVIDVECNRPEDLPPIQAALGDRYDLITIHYCDAFFIRVDSPFRQQAGHLRMMSRWMKYRRRIRRVLRLPLAPTG